MSSSADRQTGRTTAMLRQAVLRKNANGGTRILIIVHSERMISYCRAIEPSLAREDFIPLSQVRSHSFEERVRRIGREGVFIDHTVWEAGGTYDLQVLERALP